MPVEHGLERRRLRHEAGEKEAFVVFALDDRVDRVAVRRDRGDHHFTVRVLHHGGLLNGTSAPLDRLRVRVARVVHPEREVAHAVAVAADVIGDRTVRTDRRRQHEPNLVLLEEVARAVANSGLRPAVRDEVEPERGAIEHRALLGVADVELDVVGAVDRKRIVRDRRFGRCNGRHDFPPMLRLASRKLFTSASLMSRQPGVTLSSLPCFIQSSSWPRSSNR